MSINYSQLQARLSKLLVVPETDAGFVAILPQIIDYAEGRIYKDMDFLATAALDTSRSFAIGNREVDYPSLMIAVESVSVISAGTRTPLREVSLEFLNAIWPTVATTGTVSWWARVDGTKIAVAATPAAASTVEFYGKKRPAAMSSTTTTTYIGTNHSELLVTACMIFASGYQKNFGSQSDDPKMAMSWEQQYTKLLQSSLADEARRKGMGGRN